VVKAMCRDDCGFRIGKKTCLAVSLASELCPKNPEVVFRLLCPSKVEKMPRHRAKGRNMGR